MVCKLRGAVDRICLGKVVTRGISSTIYYTHPAVRHPYHHTGTSPKNYYRILLENVMLSSDCSIVQVDPILHDFLAHLH